SRSRSALRAKRGEQGDSIIRKKGKPRGPKRARGSGKSSVANGYFATGAVLASFLTLVLWLTFLVCFLVVFTAGFASVVGVLPEAGGLAWLGAWLAANMGLQGTASAGGIELFFIFFSSLRPVLPSHYSLIV